jgi:hypothetical protein
VVDEIVWHLTFNANSLGLNNFLEGFFIKIIPCLDNNIERSPACGAFLVFDQFFKAYYRIGDF